MTYRLTEEQIAAVVVQGSQALAQYCRQQNLHYVVTGSSGGLDSAVVLGFAQKAQQTAAQQGFKLTSVGLILPCQTRPLDTLRGKEVAKKFKAQIVELELDEAFESMMAGPIAKINQQIKQILVDTQGQVALAEWPWSNQVAQGNIKARLRMMLGVYHAARLLKGMVLSTDNLSEFWMAFWTICGDVGDFGIIQSLLKGLELYDIARYLGVPESIIQAIPDDGLGVAGNDADQLGAEYPLLDKVMISLIHGGFNPNGSLKQLRCLPKIRGVKKALVEKLARQTLNGSYKRRGQVVLSRKQLGLSDISEIEL